MATQKKKTLVTIHVASEEVPQLLEELGFEVQDTRSFDEGILVALPPRWTFEYDQLPKNGTVLKIFDEFHRLVFIDHLDDEKPWLEVLEKRYRRKGLRPFPGMKR